MKARSTYLQHLADGFFNFSKKVETLKLYEIEIPMRQMVKLADNCIDKLSKADLRRDDIQLRKSVCSFTPEKMSGKEMLVGAVCTGKYDLRPDFNNFDRLTKDFGLGISPRNYDVAALLYISENGYAGLMDADHFHPFSCQYEFKELAEKLGDSMKARREAPLSAHDFGYAALQMEAKTMARDILQSEFHITGGEFRRKSEPDITKGKNSGKVFVSTVQRAGTGKTGASGSEACLFHCSAEERKKNN